MSEYEDEINKKLTEFQESTQEMIDMAFDTMSKYNPLYWTSTPILRQVRDGIKKTMAGTPDERGPVTYVKEVSRWDQLLQKKGFDRLPARIRIALSLGKKDNNE